MSLMGCMLPMLLLLGLLPLAQALRATDGTRPVQVGAHVAGPLAASLRYISNADTGSGTGVWTNK